MTIENTAENIHNSYNVFRRFELPNTPDIPSYVPTNAEPQIPTEGINITNLGTEFFEGVRESYKQYNNYHILTFLIEKYCKDADLANSLDYT
ncbi:hypothetical protein O181_001371 [Austropuccinia psidii MF-1]|uniref:Uncharacterized protein n=1 Tax=Austropuccinia psidii MF-1 TaxID=1389203 RepID=A0A9Q3BA56_9BASI|nr:hypothetical protein [Austropuccinia psidii MF-1]